jgi:hypothetical protein
MRSCGVDALLISVNKQAGFAIFHGTAMLIFKFYPLVKLWHCKV